MPKKKTAAAAAPGAEIAPPDDQTKAVEVHTVVTKFRKEVAAPVAAPAPAVAPLPPDPDDDDPDDPDDPDETGVMLDALDEASGLLDEIEGEVAPWQIIVYRLPVPGRAGALNTKPEYCGPVELTENYQAEIQAWLGAGRYRCVVRWPAGHENGKGGSIRKQWDIPIGPPRPMPFAGDSRPAGASNAPAPSQTAPAEKQKTLLEQLEELATFRRKAEELGLVAPITATVTAQAGSGPVSVDEAFLKFAMSDDDVKTRIIGKYLGGAAEGESSSEWVSIAREFGPTIISVLGGLAAHFAATAPPSPASNLPPAPPPKSPAPQPSPPVPPSGNQASQAAPPVAPAKPSQPSPEESLIQLLLNGIVHHLPLIQVVKTVSQVEAAFPNMIAFVELFCNTTAESVIGLLSTRYPAAAPALGTTEALEYVKALQAALLSDETGAAA